MQPKLSAEELETVFCVPSGNFGNLTAGLIAQTYGTARETIYSCQQPQRHFSAIPVIYHTPKPSVATIANAMDVLSEQFCSRAVDLYGHSHEVICREISGVSYTDEEIGDAMRLCLKENNYLTDPHGACQDLAPKAASLRRKRYFSGQLIPPNSKKQ